MNDTRLQFKRAQIGDEKQIIALVHNVIKHSLSKIYPPAAVNWFYEYHSVAHMLDEIESGADVFTVYDGAELIGTVTYYDDELKRLFIHPDRQKEGIGKYLIDKVEALAQEANRPYIMLYANPATWRYYKAKGYEPINFAAEEPNSGEYLSYVTMTKEFTSRKWSISRADAIDAGAMLKGQKLAFDSIARKHSHMDMPPMCETLEDIALALKSCVVFNAKEDGKVIGSVRCEEKDGACYISRLWVLPEYQGRGLGHALMYEAEEEFTHLPAYKLFTGSESEETIEFYKERGYHETKRVPCESYELVYMEKMNAKNLIG